MFGAIFASSIEKDPGPRLKKVDEHLSHSRANIKKLRTMKGSFEVVYQKLFENSESLEFILENLDIFVGYINCDMVYVYANKAYEKFFKIDRYQIIGKTVKEVICSKSEELWEERKSDINDALNGKEIDFINSIDINGDGNKIKLHCRYIPHRCQITGDVKGFIVLTKPCTCDIH